MTIANILPYGSPVLLWLLLASPTAWSADPETAVQPSAAKANPPSETNQGSSATAAVHAEDTPAVSFPLAMRISAESMIQKKDRSVQHHSQINKVILETQVRGQSNTNGEYVVALIPSENRALFKIALNGKTISRTSGLNGPVTIDTTTTTDFQATKIVAYDPERGFYSGPSSIRSCTHSQTNDIRTNRRGLIDRMIRRRAWDQIEASRSEADALAQRDTEQRVRELFDEAVDKRMADFNEKYDIKKLVDLTQRPCQVYSTDSHVVMLFGEGKDRPQLPEPKTAALIELCVHKSMLGDGVVKTVEIVDSIRDLSVLFQSPVKAAERLARRAQRPWVPVIGDLEEWVSIDLGNQNAGRTIVTR